MSNPRTQPATPSTPPAQAAPAANADGVALGSSDAAAPTTVELRLTSLFEEHAQEWHGLALHLLRGRHDDAAEIVQAAFLRCWQRADQLHDVGNLRGYVATTIANLARDEYRRHDRRPAVALTTDELAQDRRRPIEPREISADLEQAEMVALVHAAIQQLRDEERTVFLLRQNAEMSYPEIAKALDLPEGTVKTRMRRALSQLRMSVRTLAESE